MNTTQVMLIESHGPDARLIRELLQASGVTVAVTQVPNVAAALARLNGDQVDLILLGASEATPAILDDLQRVRQAEPGTPVVIISHGYDANLAVCAMQGGAQDYLIKTMISPDALARVVCYAIERSRIEIMDRERKSLDRAVRGMERVLGEVGHELRTPLAAIRATAEVLVRFDSDEEQRNTFLRRIQAQAVGMTHLVEEMIEAARLRSGLVRWRWNRFDVAPMCEVALDHIRPLVGPDVVLSADIEPGELDMLGDERAIRRLLLNLLSNAARYTETGIIRVKARIATVDREPAVVFTVVDSGSGMAPEVIERLGDPFGLYGERGACELTNGTGLGLSICRRIAATHGGYLAVSSRMGRGTRVSVSLRAALPRPCQEPRLPDIEYEVAA